jgi:hypothetical protein
MRGFFPDETDVLGAVVGLLAKFTIVSLTVFLAKLELNRQHHPY